MSDPNAPSTRSTTSTSTSSDGASAAGLRALVILEQTLGHVTHGKNLERLLPDIEGFRPTFVHVAFDVNGWRARVPGFGNWTIRAGIRARRGARRVRGDARFDAAIVHTQVPAVLLGRSVGDTPIVVSLDATPKQYDSLGAHYAHEVGPAAVERLKTWLNRRCFERAAHLVVWAAWTKRSLVDDYGIEPSKITVIPPGVDTGRWLAPAEASAELANGASANEGAQTDRAVRILFVGGDLKRKGGHHVVTAFAWLREEMGTAIELHLVTTTPLDHADGIEVHDSMTPNSRELIDLYHRCDIFCLPTLGDCLPMVLAEAGAAGLALVSTDVGAIGEIVRDDETGLLVPVDDAAAVEGALRRLIEEPQLRSRLSARATEVVCAEHDAQRNAGRLVEVVRDAVTR